MIFLAFCGCRWLPYGFIVCDKHRLEYPGMTVLVPGGITPEEAETFEASA
jgi:hypothetical protein